MCSLRIDSFRKCFQYDDRYIYRSHLAASRHVKPASIFLMRLHADLKMKVLLGNRQARLDCLGIMHIDLDENNFRFSIECSYGIINI